MNKALVFIFVFSIAHFASAADTLPAGIWEGYKQMGSTYQEFVLEINATGQGYYGFSPDIKNSTPVCFAISKASLINFVSYQRQENKLNGLEFSLTLVPSIDNMFEVISAMKEPVAKKIFSQSWTLVPIERINRNSRLAELCKSFLKAHP